MSKYKMKNISNQDMSINVKSEETEPDSTFPDQNLKNWLSKENLPIRETLKEL